MRWRAMNLLHSVLLWVSWTAAGEHNRIRARLGEASRSRMVDVFGCNVTIDRVFVGLNGIAVWIAEGYDAAKTIEVIVAH